MRGHPGVERLEAEQAAHPVVAERSAHDRVEAPQGPEAQERDRRRQGLQEVGGVVVVAVEERVELEPAQAGEPVAVAEEALGLLAAADAGDLVDHRRAVGPHPQLAAVGEAGPVGGIEPGEPEVVVHPGAGGRERGLEDAGHGQHCRTGVEPEPAALEPPRPPAGHRQPFDDVHVPALAQQVAGGGQAPQPRPDDDGAATHPSIAGGVGEHERHLALICQEVMPPSSDLPLQPLEPLAP